MNINVMFFFFVIDDIWNYFNGRRNLYCIAGYTQNKINMKDYYLSDVVSSERLNIYKNLYYSEMKFA